MTKTIGIPRAMYFYEFYPVWEAYFKSLGFEILLSPKTNKDILNAGILACVDEACLPVKIFHGHVVFLKDKVDYIFIPRIIGLHKREYNCPKHLGLSDMIKSSIDGLPEIIDPIINLRNKNGVKIAVKDMKNELKLNYSQKELYKNAIREQEKYKKNLLKTDISLKKDEKSSNLLILGHPYNVYDEFINMNILEKLKDEDLNLFFAEDIPEKDYREYSSQFIKRIFWTQGRKLIGSSYYLIDNELIDGIMYLSAFGCGLDSMLVYLVEKKCIEKNIPMIVLTLDEQTGEAGFVTRIDAFLDMMEWRKKDENNLSTFR
ncbi:acyl-CoA dehydratase activase-related protein [Paratissierella segnis]|jgi:predicted nucleotide-binding protein (sugar kinase/HSP70/actin superfamily)|uniref:DUF2229 domain-containing protein n=1 Tax=Paratissierella segnis TaxID=2763679 RepID=A0A926EVU9_9FIRM|nr:acyl-CoA dehydratase activase-related protein [Paratissierella segnis]MBC8588546.1 hypothetical protein [Paratissierella segnis]